jgi:transcriptional regulator GlxA family with amidase domain
MLNFRGSLRMSVWDFRSQSSGEVQEFLGGIYAENRLKLLGTKGRPSRTLIHGADLGEIAQYDVSYSSPFTLHFETRHKSCLILTCTAGIAKLHMGDDLIEFSAGHTAAVSAAEELRVECRDSLAHISTHIDSDAINSTCARLLGHSLDEPVLFERSHFTDELKGLWDLVTWSLNKLIDDENPPSLSIDSLSEYAMTLLLEKHPHNYSRLLERRRAVTDQQLREARHFIEQNAHREITAGDVASFVGCGTHALNEGFREHLGMTPRTCLHFARMTLARSRLASSKRDDHARGLLSPAKINLLRHHINVSLGKRITVGRLASLVCMSPQSFTPAFKRTFGTTPAQYILTERLKWARWLLQNTDDAISAIAAETGFSSQSHLTSIMKHHTGDTPNEVRRAVRPSVGGRYPLPQYRV